MTLPVAEGALDSQTMFDWTAQLPEFLNDGAQQAKNKSGLPSPDGITSICVLGMGGSGVSGEVLRACGAMSMTIPVVLTDGYELPAFVGPSTLVIANSFSGNTEETLTAVRVAHERDAKIVAITSGGELAKLAAEWAIPRYELPTIIPQPRAGLGAMVGPILILCEEMGFLPGAGKAIDDAVAQMRIRRDELTAKGGGIGGEIARRLGRTFPLIYGAEGIGAVAARRWKTQVNENAKAPAFFAAQPELCHNEICGFGQNGDVTRQVIGLVLLRSDFEPPRIDPRFSLVTEFIREAVADIIELKAEGNGPLAQMFDLIYVGDFVSLHLAVKEGIDPGPVAVLVELKEQLAKI